MGVYYVDGIAGSDGNNGLSRATAKATVAGTIPILQSGVPNLVLIRPHTYLLGSAPTAHWNLTKEVLYRPDPIYPGDVIMDFQESLSYQTLPSYAAPLYWWPSRGGDFMGIHFRNMAAGVAAFATDLTGANIMHCVFYSQNGTPRGIAATGHTSTPVPLRFRNCSFYNLEECFKSSRGDGIGGNTVYGCYANTVTSWSSNDNGALRDYNAYSGNTETNGIDTAVTDPGFRNVGTLDFRLDPSTTPADYAAFMGGGIDNGRIAAFGSGGIYYRADISPLRFLSANPNAAAGNPQPSWENEGPNGTNTYTDGTPGDIIEDPSNELVVDLTTTPAATGGRIRSPVYDMGTVGSPELIGAAFAALEPALSAAPGGAIDVDDSNPRVIEYRSSATNFAPGAGTPTWQTYSQGTALSVTDQYFQFRVEFRTGHTNT